MLLKNTFGYSAQWFVKISATSNDFILVDQLTPMGREVWSRPGAPGIDALLIQQWCNRTDGLGADGFVVVKPHADLDFKWDFYNSDGSVAKLCGNAARAVAWWYHLQTRAQDMHFLTAAGTVNASILAEDSLRKTNKVSVQLPSILEFQLHLKAKDEMGTIPYQFVNAGVPHAVVNVRDLGVALDNKELLKDFALRLKAQAVFQSDGVNVTFVDVTGAQNVRSLTFERGVEGFTLSCGTGAVAAAFYLKESSVPRQVRQVEVLVPGGRLEIHWEDEQPTLIGPAQVHGQFFPLEGSLV